MSHSPNVTQSQYHTVPLSHSPNVTQSHCHTDPMSHSPNITHNISTQYPSIQSILHSSTHLISSHNISPLFKQFHSSCFLPIATHYSMTLCTDIRSCRRGFTMIQFCLVYHQIVQPNLIKTQYWLFSVNVQKFLIFQSYWYSNQYNNLQLLLHMADRLDKQRPRYLKFPVYLHTTCSLHILYCRYIINRLSRSHITYLYNTVFTLI